MTSTKLPFYAQLSLYFFATWCFAIGFLLFDSETGTPILRWSICTGAILLFSGLIMGSCRRYILSPLFLLGIIPILFYSVGPSIYELMFADPIRFFGNVAPRTSHDTAIEYIGSRGEHLILQSSSFFLLVFSFLIYCRGCFNRKHGPQENCDRSQRYILIFYCVGVLALSFSFFASKWLPLGQSFFSSGFGSEIRHALAPSMSICVAAVAYLSAHQSGVFRAIGPVVIIIGLLTMITSGLAATAAFILLAAILLYLLELNISVTRFITAGALTALLIPIAILITIVARGENQDSKNRTSVVEYSAAKLTSKLIFRQTTSGHCLDKIYRNFQSAETKNPFYFVIAVVPRILWSEKPILSRGSEYAEIYCGQTGARKLHHSESITLLGEPLLNGGILGIVTAQITLAVILSLATILGISGHPVRVIVMVALLPWLATFEQHFAEYFGNLIKVILIMSPFLIALTYQLRRHQTRRTKPSAA